MRLLLLAALVALPLAAAGCDTTRDTYGCTLIGCSDALLVRVATVGPPPSGRYVVRATGDETRSCAFTLAPDATDTGDGCLGVWIDDGDLVVTLEPLRGALRIDVERDDALVARGSGVAVYEPQYPNGVRCGAVCEVARVTVGGL
ncbi:hypothetical protein [Rubrivirga sp. IMCC43871]|uniref:hypothetical protein n=1 Tax=Rubrivirga sp. IMCC43871 TaxID=3391575 RepID=UPI00398FC0C8